MSCLSGAFVLAAATAPARFGTVAGPVGGALIERVYADNLADTLRPALTEEQACTEIHMLLHTGRRATGQCLFETWLGSCPTT